MLLNTLNPINMGFTPTTPFEKKLHGNEDEERETVATGMSGYQEEGLEELMILGEEAAGWQSRGRRTQEKRNDQKLKIKGKKK